MAIPVNLLTNTLENDSLKLSLKESITITFLFRFYQFD